MPGAEALAKGIAKIGLSKSAKRNRRLKELAKIGKMMSGKSKKPRNRKNKGLRGAGNAELTTANFPGNTEFETKGGGGGRKSRKGISLPGMETLPERGREFVHRHCNPCGEMVTFTESSKIPDGALPNSLVLELREAFIVRYPGATTSALPLDGTMWNLTVVHLPAFRTSCLLIAKATNSELTPTDRELVVQDWNSAGNEPPRFPNWVELTTDDLWYTSVGWTALANVDPPTTAGTTSVQQFRITSDGMTIFNNTPDLINQGMCIGAQWPLNVSTVNEIGEDSEDGYTGNIILRIYLTTVGSNTGVSVLSIPLPVDVSTVATVSSTNMTYITNDQAAYPWGTITPRATTTAAAGAIVFTVDASLSFVFNGVAVSAGDQLQFSFTRTAGNQGTAVWTAVVDDVTTSTNVYTLPSQSALHVSLPLVVTSPIEMPSVTKFQLPPTETQTIIQSTPKSCYWSMKEENGCYMVKRVFQPVFGVQEANQRKQIIMADPNVEDRNFTMAPLDVFDLNFGVGVVVMSAIPTSCAPAIKLIRDVEIVAGQDSVYMPIMKSNEDKIEAALEIVKCMADHHPMMYPESYNILGGLMSLISGVVGKVPILGNVFNAVKGIVKGVTSQESTAAPSGASQNRLTSMNVSDLANIAEMLLAQLRGG